MARGQQPADSVHGAIFAVRSRMGFSQAELGRYLAVDQTTVSQYETGRAKPSAEQLIKLLGIASTDQERVPILNSLEADYGLFASDVALFLPDVEPKEPSQ